MRRLKRRELFKRTAQAGVGGAALAAGLKPGTTADVPIEVGDAVGIPLKITFVTTSGSVRDWAEIWNEEVGISGLGPEYEMSVEEDEET